jgi:hypothetical protein
MEILKFDESGASSPSRKRSGRGAILVTFVALVFGAGTALASGTLTVNSGADIELAQGVTQTTQCDTSVDISINSALDFPTPSPSASPTPASFYLHQISVRGISDNCLGKTLRLKVYNTAGIQQTFCKATTTADSGCTADVVGTYVEGTPVNESTSDANTLSFTFSNILLIQDANTAKNITIETIS